MSPCFARQNTTAMGALDTPIITGTVIRTITGKSEGLEDEKLKPAIHEAQHELQQILGETLYGDMEAAYGDSPQWDGRSDLQTLYNDHCKFFLSWKTLENAYPDLYAAPERNGVFTREGKDYKPTSTKWMEVLIAKARSRAEKRQSEMLRYLRNLNDGDAVKVAFNECVKNEPRVGGTYFGGLIARRKREQYPFREMPGRNGSWRNEC